MEDYWTECQYYDIVWVCFVFGNCNHCCFCCGHPCTMLGVSLFISCKNKIQCVCVKKKNLVRGVVMCWTVFLQIRCVEVLTPSTSECDCIWRYVESLFFFKIFLFWCGPNLKSLLNLLQYCFCFIFWFFGHKACGILAPRTGIEPAPTALEGEVLTTGLPGKSL